MKKPQLHWPEYAMEAGCLATFMIAATALATLLQHPLSAVHAWIQDPLLARGVMGLGMGATAVAIIYSGWGRRSGAHMNPAVTLAFLRLGKINRIDAAAYIVAQTAGGVVGIIVATVLLADLPSDRAVNYVATLPGPHGPLAALLGETAISFVMMTSILVASNHAKLAPYTGAVAGAMVATFIVFEQPLSGMSMNPARSFGPAVLAGSLSSMWIYVAGPLGGMLAAAETFVRVRSHADVRCGKLVHARGVRCIFRCGHADPVQEAV